MNVEFQWGRPTEEAVSLWPDWISASWANGADDSEGEAARLAIERHSLRTALTSAWMAVEVGWSRDEARELLTAARSHDVGKLLLPQSLWQKQGCFDERERALMRTHAALGSVWLEGAAGGASLASRVARSHHERWDGSGYPDGLTGEEIPAEARIVAVADVFDALTEDRPYRAARSHDVALRWIESRSGTHFEPAAVTALTRLLERPSGSTVGALQLSMSEGAPDA